MRTAKTLYLLLEFTALFIVLPILLYLGVLPTYVIPTLVWVAGICFLALYFSRDFERKQLFNISGGRGHWRRVLLTFGVAAVVLTAFTVLFERPALLWLPRNRPVIWGIVMIAYPLLSVYPQEVIYRAFLFHRYRHVFPTAPGRLCISALAFALVHIVFHNNVALVLSLAGGFLFALTYHRTRSLAVVWLEHALYGCLIFTVGLGTRFFYQGSLRAAEDTARTYTESR